jgi:hypothetical protein
MVCAELFALLAPCASALTPMNNVGRMKMTAMFALSSARRNFGAFASFCFMTYLLITKIG